MKYAILGAGSVGTAIARGVKSAGHDVVAADTDQSALDEMSAQLDSLVTTTDSAQAAAAADVVVLAVPFPVVEELVTGMADALDGKVVIDATNPLTEDFSGLVTDQGPAGAERVQAAAPGARVVKAFNTVFAGNQAVAEVEGVQLDGFVAGDDDGAKRTVMELLQAIGFRTIDVGKLANARYLEGMAYLNITLNAFNDLPWQSGWKLLGPVPSTD